MILHNIIAHIFLFSVAHSFYLSSSSSLSFYLYLFIFLPLSLDLLGLFFLAPSFMNYSFMQFDVKIL